MTTPESLQDDVRFLAGAVERQRRLHRALISKPVAVTWAVYVLYISVVNSALLWEHTHGWAGPTSLAGLALALIVTALAPVREWRRQGEVVEHSWADLARVLLPWAGCTAAVFLFLPIAAIYDIRAGARFLVAVILVALTAFQVGLAGSWVMLGVGIGGGVGVMMVWLAPVLGPIGLAVPFFIGLVGGAILEDRRIAQR